MDLIRIAAGIGAGIPLGELVNQGVAAGNALMQGRAAGERERQDRAQREEERTLKQEERARRQREAEQQSAMFELQREKLVREGRQSERELQAMAEAYERLPPSMKAVLGPRVAGVDYRTYLTGVVDDQRDRASEERKHEREKELLDDRQDFDRWQHTTPSGSTVYSQREQNARSAADREAGITAGVNREYDYWQQVVDNYVEAAGGDANAALATLHRNPQHHRARVEGRITGEMFQGAASRYRRSAAGQEGEQMSWSQAGEILRREEWFGKLSAHEQRQAMARYRNGQDPRPPAAAPAPAAQPARSRESSRASERAASPPASGRAAPRRPAARPPVDTRRTISQDQATFLRERRGMSAEEIARAYRVLP